MSCLSFFLLLFSITSYADDLSKYEVPENVKEQHEECFYEKSYNYEDALRKLQLVLIVDKSGSQQASDSHPLNENQTKGIFGNRWTQWDNTFYAAKYLAESIFEYDADGHVPLVFFGHEATSVEAKSIGQMLLSFKKEKPTNETTNLVSALQLAFEKYSSPSSEDEKILFIVLTDGSPNSGQEPVVEKIIEENLKKNGIKDEALNILFVRIGDDPGAVQFLNNLDNSTCVGDVVDTKSDNMVYQMGPKNLILNAIFEHLDKEYQE